MIPNDVPALGVLAPLTAAWEHTRLVLFNPFDLGKWLILGFSCLLSEVASYGSSLNFNSGDSSESGSGSLENLWAWLQSSLGDWAPLVLGLGVVAMVILVLLIIAIVLALLWVNCHGVFVFIDNVANNRARIVAPWKSFAPQARSLFKFVSVAYVSFILGIAGLVVAALGLSSLLQLVRLEKLTEKFASDLFMVIFVMGLVGMLIVAGLLIFGIRAIVIPRMYLTRCHFIEASKDAWTLFCHDPFLWLRFVLMVVALWIGLVMVILFACLFTCCLAALPYLHHVLLLPIYLFMLSYNLKFLAQFGGDWDVFQVRQPPAFPSAPIAS